MNKKIITLRVTHKSNKLRNKDNFNYKFNKKQEIFRMAKSV